MSKYPMVGCSQCGQSFGPGDSGYSACKEHRRAPTSTQIAAMQAPDKRPQNCGQSYCSCIECPYPPRSAAPPTRSQLKAMKALPAAIKRENDAYTQGRLRAGLPTSDGIAFPDRLHTTDGVMVAMAFGPEGQADVRRLAACWNACAGIPTAALELCGTCISSTQGEPS